MIKAIIFDWGGVLIEEPKEKLIEYCAQKIGVSALDLGKILSLYSPYWQKFQKGEIEEKVLWSKICKKLRAKKCPEGSLWGEAVVKIFTDRKEVHKLAKDLRKKGYKIGFLSNTEIPTREYFFNKGYDKHFDAIIFSCDEKTAKPEKKIYSLALKRLEVKPEEAVFIDNMAKYVQGAKKAGLHGIVFENFKQLVKELNKLGVKGK